MLSVAATQIITAFTSPLPGMIAKQIPASASSTEVFVTVLAAIALTSILTGAFLLLGGLR